MCGQGYTLSVGNPGVFGNYTGNVLRNNFFEADETPSAGQPADWCDQQMVSSGPPITYEYNSFSGWVTANSGSSVVKGNIFFGQGEVGTADHNVSTEAAGADKVCTPKMADGNSWSSVTVYSGNLHLSASDTCADGAGDSGSYPPLDIDEQTRTSPPWAGADES